MNLADLMILVAGIAVSLWLVPEGTVHETRRTIRIAEETRSVRLMAHWATFLLTEFSQPIVAAWTLTVLVLALRRSPSPRRLASQPGFTACAAATLAMVIVGPLNFAAARPNLVPGLPMMFRLPFYLGHALTFPKAEAGIAVSAAWATAAFGGLWRPEPSWIDRGGRILGAFWIAMVPVTWIGPMII